MHRIGLGWAAFEKNRILLSSNRIPMHVKRKIYETYILQVVLYGLDCVNWTSLLCGKIETFQNHIMRAMTNKTLLDHVKVTDLRITTGLNPLVSLIKSRVLKLTIRPVKSMHRRQSSRERRQRSPTNKMARWCKEMDRSPLTN